MEEAHSDFYRKIRVQINNWLDTRVGREHKWSEYILLAPDIFYLLVKLIGDKDVPDNKKFKLGAAILYFISPIDILPEAILGPIGYIDDIALAAYVLNQLVLEVDPKVISRHWAGERDILDLIKTIIANADKMIGSGAWKKLRDKVKGKKKDDDEAEYKVY
jgi:uncharacterized membrane protein YkvA (DUF1232 family)